MKHICVGVMAHVDAGKTTLLEAMLFKGGATRRLGRVDHQNAFLDTDEQERARGITIFSKQAELALPEASITFLDTPGHVDFSAEMERTLQVLDFALLLVSGTDGVQSHTRTLWQLLRRYRIPTFLFVNKMDLPGKGKDGIMEELRRELSEGCVAFDEDTSALYEELALFDEGLRVPEDISVAGYDGLRIGGYFVPKLTTIAQSVDLLAECSFDLLLACMQGAQAQHLTVPFRLLTRQSVRQITEIEG